MRKKGNFKIKIIFWSLFLSLFFPLAKLRAKENLKSIPDKCDGFVIVKEPSIFHPKFLVQWAQALSIKKGELENLVSKGIVVSFYGEDFLLALPPQKELCLKILKGFGAKEKDIILSGKIGSLDIKVVPLYYLNEYKLYLMERGGEIFISSSKNILKKVIEAEESPLTKSILSDTQIRSAAEEGINSSIFAYFRIDLFKKEFKTVTGIIDGVSSFIWFVKKSGNKYLEKIYIEWPEPRTGIINLAGKGLKKEFLDVTAYGFENVLVGKINVLEKGLGGKDLLSSRLKGVANINWKKFLSNITGSFFIASNKGSSSWVCGCEALDTKIIGNILGSANNAISFKAENDIVVFGSDRSWVDRINLNKRGASHKIDLGSSFYYKGSKDFLKILTPRELKWFFKLEKNNQFEFTINTNPAFLKIEFIEENPILPNLMEENIKPHFKKSKIKEITKKEKKGSGIEWKALSPEERYKALDALLKTGRVTLYSDEVIKLLDDEEESVAALAAYALGKEKIKKAVPILIGIARNSKKTILRRYAVYALMKIGDPRAESVFIKALRDKDYITRGLGATGLEVIGSKKASKPLGTCIFTSLKADPETRIRLYKAIAKVGGPEEIYKILLSVKKTDSEDVKKACVYALQKLTPALTSRKEIGVLTTMLDHPVMSIRKYAIERLAEIGADEPLAAMKKRLEIEDKNLVGLLKLAIKSIEAKNKTKIAISSTITKTAKKVGSIEKKASDIVAKIKAMPVWKKAVLAAFPLILICLIWALKILIDKRKTKETAEKVASLVNPSEEYEEYQEDLIEEDSEEDVAQLELDDAEEIESLVPPEEDDPFLKKD